jgi:hypothetical protein
MDRTRDCVHFAAGIWQTLCMTECSRFLAHDPPKCERFGEKIMRSFKRLERDLGTNEGVPAKPASTFADRALYSANIYDLFRWPQKGLK